MSRDSTFHTSQRIDLHQCNIFHRFHSASQCLANYPFVLQICPVSRWFQISGAIPMKSLSTEAKHIGYRMPLKKHAIVSDEKWCVVFRVQGTAHEDKKLLFITHLHTHTLLYSLGNSTKREENWVSHFLYGTCATMAFWSQRNQRLWSRVEQVDPPGHTWE